MEKKLYCVEYTETITRVEYVKASSLEAARRYAMRQLDEGAPNACEHDSAIKLERVEAMD